MQETLRQERKELMKISCISDALHGLIFLALYLFDLISGYALLAAVLMATVIAVVLAAVTKRHLQASDRIAIIIIALGAASAVGFFLYAGMQQTPLGSLLSGLTAGSIVIVGAFVGRKIKQVIVGLEDLKSIAEDDFAQQEVSGICRLYPELEAYRQQALQILRPNLTYGELRAMQKWAADHRPTEASERRS